LNLNMSSIQIGLAIAGGLILALVVLHSAWTSHRRQPRQAEPEPVRLEPGVEPSPQSQSADDSALDALPLPLPLADKTKPLLDPLIDVIAQIDLDVPVPGEAVLTHLPPTRRLGSKPLNFEGLNEQTGQWEQPMAGQRYSSLQAGVQLANRAGALNEIEYSEFVVKTQALADGLGGTPDFPEMLDEVARSRELDQFAGAHDAQLSITLRARNAAWSPGYVHQHASRLGFVAGVMPGRMVLPASESGLPPVLALTFDAQAALAEDPAQSALFVVTLTLDVPQVGRAEQPFARMREAADRLAQAMDGSITDDNGQPLGQEALDQIARELDKLYNTLESRDIAAGTQVARRLFS